MSNNKFLANESVSITATKLSAWDNTGVSGEKIPANVPTNPDGSAQTQALTDAQLRASAISVNTGLTQGLTDAQLRASAVPVSLASTTVSNFPSNQTVNGTVDLSSASLASLESITVQNGAGGSAVNIQDGGNSITVDGAVTANAGTNLNTSALNLEATQSAINTKLPAGLTVKAASTAAAAADQALVVVISPNNIVPVSGPLTDAQLRASAVPTSLASIPLATNAATDRTTAAAPYSNRLSDGTAFYDARQIRALTASDIISAVQSGAWSVSVSNFPATQAVTGTFFQATQPISNVKESSSSAAITSATNAITSFSVVAANANRKGLLIHNDSTTTVLVAFAATASATAFSIRLTSQASYNMPFPVYTGAISAIATAANGSLRITELT